MLYEDDLCGLFLGEPFLLLHHSLSTGQVIFCDDRFTHDSIAPRLKARDRHCVIMYMRLSLGKVSVREYLEKSEVVREWMKWVFQQLG